MATKFNPRTPSKPASAPLKPSQQPNLSSTNAPYSFLNDSPSSYLPPKDGAVKLKVKSGVTPEARIRLGASQNGLRPVTPRPTKLRSVIVSATPRSQSRLGNEGEDSGSRVSSRGMTPSGSDGSLKDWDKSVISGGGDIWCGNGVDQGELEDLAQNETVLVSVRVRPGGADESSVWRTLPWDPQTITLAKELQGTREDREWNFDRILGQDSDNIKAYTTAARTHVKRAMEGYNALIFAYGQTASGKTHTLSGSLSAPGIIPLAIRDLFAQIRSSPDRDFLLRASYLELYNETLYDLLSGDSKELSLSEGKKKGEVVVGGLTECAVRTEEEVGRLLKVGEEGRKVGRTDWNARSSRSHCVFRLGANSKRSSNPEHRVERIKPAVPR